jgi:hypothetical protein
MMQQHSILKFAPSTDTLGQCNDIFCQAAGEEIGVFIAKCSHLGNDKKGSLQTFAFEKKPIFAEVFF